MMRLVFSYLIVEFGEEYSESFDRSCRVAIRDGMKPMEKSNQAVVGSA